MSFNYGSEWKKFTEEQKRLAKQYKAVGMADAAIQALYKDALAWFNSRRKEARYAANPMSMMKQDPDTGDYRYMDMDEFPADQPLVNYGNRFSWILDIENSELYKAIIAMKPDYIEIITLMMEGYAHADIAKMRGVSPDSVNKKIAHIRKILKTFK